MLNFMSWFLSGWKVSAYWNFEKYKRDTGVKSPKEWFRQLPVSKKLSTVDVLFSFLENVNKKKDTLRLTFTMEVLCTIFQQITPQYVTLIFSKKFQSLTIKELTGLEQNV